MTVNRTENEEETAPPGANDRVPGSGKKVHLWVSYGVGICQVF